MTTHPAPVLPSLRRRPISVACLVAVRLAGAFAASAPLAAVVGSLLAHHERGEERLLDAGSLLLFEVLREIDLAWLAPTQLLVLCALALASLLCVSGLLHALAKPDPLSVRQWLAGAASPLGVLAAAGVGALLLQGVLGAGLVALGASLGRLADEGGTTRTALQIAGMTLAIVAVGLVRIWHDLLRAGVAGLGGGLADAGALALRALWSDPIGLGAAYGLRALSAVLLGVAGVGVALRFGLGASSSVAAVAAIQGGIVVAIALIRASWLAVALGAVRALPSRSHRAELACGMLPG